MKLLAKRNDGWGLYDDEGQYIESPLDLTKTGLSWEGFEQLKKTNQLKDLMFGDEFIKDIFSDKATNEDVKQIVELLLPYIIELWKADKIQSFGA